jgi:hypothetical protein
MGRLKSGCDFQPILLSLHAALQRSKSEFVWAPFSSHLPNDFRRAEMAARDQGAQHFLTLWRRD